MQRLYALARGNGKALKLNLNGVEGLFSAQTPDELRCVEGAALFNEREMLSAIQETLKPGDVFLDVGSSLGIFTVFGAKAVGPQGTVVACEPGTSSCNRLQMNIELNRLNNVTRLKLALSDRRSVRKLLLGESSSLSHLTDLPNVDGSSENVQTADYDSLVEEEGLPIPRLVKMDIEGHEYAALKGMERTLSSPLCVALFCEIHPYALPVGVSLGEVTALIEAFGFECVSTRARAGEYHVTAMKNASAGAIGRAGQSIGAGVRDSVGRNGPARDRG